MMLEATVCNRPVALITGGSSGIGAALAECFVRDGHDVVLVGRDIGTLEAHARALQALGGSAVAIQADLSDPKAPAELQAQLEARRIPVRFLINSAGVGVFGEFAASPLERNLAMLRLNIMAPTELCHLFLKQVSAHGGAIVNVSSLAAFQPGPYMAVYYASKAYLLWFSEAIEWELRPLGVRVMTLCPGPTETRFARQAGMEASGLIRGKRLADPARVANGAYRALQSGKRVHVHGIGNRLLALGARLAPRRWVVAAVAAMSAPRTE
jgi:short-subunit dehydrogenase